MTPQEIEALKAERDALAAQVEKMKYYITKYQELGADFILNEALTKTPQQCLLDVQAEAGRTGFVAGFKESGEGFNGEYGASEKRIYQLADEHAAKVRQGGAE